MKKIFFLLIVLSVACSPKIKKTNAPLAYDMINFGEGGGITGAYSSYVLQGNGELVRQYRFPNKPYQQKFIRQTTTDSVAVIFNKLKELDKWNYQTTGNITYHIELRKDSSIHKINWGTEKNDTTLRLKEMYLYLKGFAQGKN